MAARARSFATNSARPPLASIQQMIVTGTAVMTPRKKSRSLGLPLMSSRNSTASNTSM